MNLAEIREKIDILDREILDKLNERLELALQTRELKSEIPALRRESQIFAGVRKYAQKLPIINTDFAEKIFRGIIAESRRLQKEER